MDFFARYGLSEARATPLPSERDRNYRLSNAEGEWVLKVSQAGEERGLLECQNEILKRLAAGEQRFRFPRVRAALDGAEITTMAGPSGAEHFVRVVEWLPGEPLATVRPHTPELLRSIGTLFGALDRVLLGYEHPAAVRDFYWDLRHGLRTIERNLGALRDPARRERVTSFLPVLRLPESITERLRLSVIHNDGNDYNLIARAGTLTEPGEPVLVGLLDFGDVVRTWTVAELAIACAYAMLGKSDPLAAAAAVTAGYHEEFPLTEIEIAALYPLICTRLCLSVTLAAVQRAARPDNEYLSISEQPAWALLEQLSAIHPSFAHYRLRAACSLEPCPTAQRTRAWLQDQTEFPPILPEHDLASARVFDFSVSSLEFGAVAGSSDAAVWTEAVFGEMRRSGVSAAIGRYDEPRPWYTAPAFRGESDGAPDWRTIHIGIDLFAEPGTVVSAPVDGVVHSFRDNAGHLDYGPTIILQHDVAPDLTFYTLYGHLSRESLVGLQVGARVRAGLPIATIGAAEVNGGWSPHLHFQLMCDLFGRRDEFPGVGRPSERDLWRSVCPDPNLVLRVPQLAPAPRAKRAELLAERKDRIGPSLSIAYRTPLIIERGWKQFLYDEEGQPYLDAVNNVAHVGHSHPRVVDALKQAYVLNTNTRYLHDNLTAYAERLTATLPEPLRVCFFVCSGSEANELALRLARAHTRAHDVIVIDGAYHGNTTALIDLSPYKFDGAGGAGRPSHVQVVPLPDGYRGRYRGSDATVGRQYAAHVQSAIERVHERGERVAAFFVESLPGCGGQIVPPAGYLAACFEHARAAGAVCVADEVQTGLGRVGSHFWAFETQGVIPDIVTVGKPIGNGHPLGAVITTPEIAASFANGMEYFNTFGGNPVSCAVGMAVLDVIEQEGLQANALTVGKHLLRRLEALQSEHALVGDVRGLGLYIGVELVLDRAARTPAGAAASYVANRMRERGILLSTDGPAHNVLKIKPPLVFALEHADQLADVLGNVLHESTLHMKAM